MRNHAIDFLRGLIAIHIIMIHTVFHSGSMYLDNSIQCWFLLFDVPIFLVISGMTYSFHSSPRKKLKEILTFLFKWAIFVFCCFGYLFIIDKSNISLKDIPSWLVFRPQTNSGYITGIINSLWFMAPFINASIICSIIIYSIKKFLKIIKK